MTLFTPVESAIGATLIQIASTSFIYSIGQPLGFSSLIYNAFTFRSLQASSVVLGVLLSSSFSSYFLPDFVVPSSSHYLSQLSIGTIALAGFLSGLGTSYGCGCTSGHMIGGISRLRTRSIVATMVFSGTAVVVAFLNYTPDRCYVIGSKTEIPCYQYDKSLPLYSNNSTKLKQILGICVVFSYGIVTLIVQLAKGLETNSVIKKVVKFVIGLNSGFWFGLGLTIAGMTNPLKVLGFLSFTRPQYFDPSLVMIVVFTIIPNVVLWNFILPLPQTLNDSTVKMTALNEKFGLNYSSETPLRFIVGCVLFGLGWGIAGVCPGPGLANLVFMKYQGSVWMISFILGYYLTKIK